MHMLECNIKAEYWITELSQYWAQSQTGKMLRPAGSWGRPRDLGTGVEGGVTAPGSLSVTRPLLHSLLQHNTHNIHCQFIMAL